MCAGTVALLSVIVAVCLLGLPGVALALSGTWTLDGSALWDDAVTAPWSGGIVADGAGYVWPAGHRRFGVFRRRHQVRKAFI